MTGQEGVKKVAISPMRNAIARLMTKSFNTAPHFFNFETIDASGLIAYRSSFPKDDRPTYNDLIIYAASRAIKESPELNARWAEDHIEQYDSVNVGIIVAVDGGIICQVLNDADKKDLKQISAESKDLIEKANNGKLVTGKATFTISNPGPQGPRALTGVINPPQAAILTVGAIHKDVVVGDDDKPAVRPVFKVCLACDHRMVDGRSPAIFLSNFKGICGDFG